MRINDSEGAGFIEVSETLVPGNNVSFRTRRTLYDGSTEQSWIIVTAEDALTLAREMVTALTPPPEPEPVLTAEVVRIRDGYSFFASLNQDTREWVEGTELWFGRPYLNGADVSTFRVGDVIIIDGDGKYLSTQSRLPEPKSRYGLGWESSHSGSGFGPDNTGYQYGDGPVFKTKAVAKAFSDRMVSTRDASYGATRLPKDGQGQWGPITPAAITRVRKP